MGTFWPCKSGACWAFRCSSSWSNYKLNSVSDKGQPCFTPIVLERCRCAHRWNVDISIISLQCCQHIALNADARQVLLELLTSVKSLLKVHKASVEAAMLLAWLQCLTGLNECPHDENVVRCAVVASEASLACSSQAVDLSPAADSAQQYSRVKLEENCADNDASVVVWAVLSSWRLGIGTQWTGQEDKWGEMQHWRQWQWKMSVQLLHE